VASSAIIAVWRIRQAMLRFLTASSVRKMEASKAPVSFSVLTAVRMAAEFLLAEILFLAQADQQDAFAKVPGTLCSSSVVPALPSMSPRRTMSEM
jgi:hypothetical protein